MADTRSNPNAKWTSTSTMKASRQSCCAAIYITLLELDYILIVVGVGVRLILYVVVGRVGVRLRFRLLRKRFV